MSIEAHSLAVETMAQGEARLRAGDVAGARRLFEAAVELEVKALSTIPEDRIRTRSVIAVSAASLYARALKDWAAVNLAAQYLANPELPEDVRRDLVDLIVSSERHRELGPGAHQPWSPSSLT